MINNSKNCFIYGDIVEVLQPMEILDTLDSDGQLDGLPFMPEMIPYCGKKFKVLAKAEKTCVTCPSLKGGVTTKIKEFIYNDVVFLKDLRCTGIDHDNCQRGCMIFWKQSWLKKVGNETGDTLVDLEDARKLRERLQTKMSEEKYFCQSTQLNGTTKLISPLKRVFKMFKETFCSKLNILDAIKSVVLPGWKIINKIPQPKGLLRETPIEELNLEPGELVEVKSFSEIIHSLDKKGRNKGLNFTSDMKQYCGKQFKVRNKLERMILEETGEMLEIKNTVILEGVICSYPYRFAGCLRAELHYWREIWLKRVTK